MFNFKALRLFYARVSDEQRFHAVFADDEIFYTMTIFASAFSVLFVTLPTIVAAVFGLIYIELWYSVKIFCVECILIEAYQLIVMPIDMYRIITNAKGFKTYAAGGPGISKTFAVRSGVGGDDEDESLLKPTNMLGATSEVIRIMRDYLR